MLRSLLPSLLAAAALASSAAAAQAAEPERLSVPVKVGDLNLRSEDGARVALNRIHRAAATICGETDSKQLARQAMIDACVRDAVNTTVAQAHSPALAALNGTPVQATTLAAAR
jgi:UrcA family protein